MDTQLLCQHCRKCVQRNDSALCGRAKNSLKKGGSVMARKSPSKNVFVLTLPLRCEAWQHRGTDLREKRKILLAGGQRLPEGRAVRGWNSGNGPTGPRHRREQHLRHCGAVWRALQLLREGGRVCPAGLPLTAKLHFMPFWGRFVQRRPFFMLPGVS